MLNKGFNKLAQVIDMQKHMDDRNRKLGSFTNDERKVLERMNFVGRAYKIMKDIEFCGADARTPKMGERALLYLTSTPQVPLFEIIKRKGGGFLLHNGHFKEPKKYSDINLLARHVRAAINNHKSQIQAKVFGAPKFPVNR